MRKAGQEYLINGRLIPPDTTFGAYGQEKQHR